MKATAVTFALALVLSACTASDPDHGVVDDELLRPGTSAQDTGGLRTDQADPARSGDCAQLDGVAVRDCLERAQSMPKRPRQSPAQPRIRGPGADEASPGSDGRQPPGSDPAHHDRR